ncbi:hypothetical protein CWI36_2672p0010 [Hamiltosporidium magnivora]|uniref:Uncharacterized protein n=1 Tax=Hamiltosporidium magnivora TaxID=148818 RepID=A0A4Q9KTI3_9MICR|nr:hypothetical protein CWI36_2672p0010 [Hamiltosporidium magnivora]
MKKTESSESDNDSLFQESNMLLGIRHRSFPIRLEKRGIRINQNYPVSIFSRYLHRIIRSYSTQILGNFAYAFQNKKGEINESVNSEIGVTKKTSNSDTNKVVNSSPEKVICIDKYKSKIVTLFEVLPATYLKNSPEINDQKHLDVSALKERMKKIYQRKENKNLRLKRFAECLNKLDGEELLEFLISANIMAKRLSVKKIEIINRVLMDNKLDILALAETWRDDIDNLNTNYRLVARLLSKQVKKR